MLTFQYWVGRANTYHDALCQTYLPRYLPWWVVPLIQKFPSISHPFNFRRGHEGSFLTAASFSPFICPLYFFQLCSMCSVTRLGDFRRFLITYFLIKVAQMYGAFWGYFEKHYFLSEKYWGFFWAMFELFCATFYIKTCWLNLYSTKAQNLYRICQQMLK